MYAAVGGDLRDRLPRRAVGEGPRGPLGPNRACYLAIGVTLEGEREVLGIWWRDSEGAKFWLAVLNDLHQRGTRDVLICCVDGLEGFRRRSGPSSRGLGGEVCGASDPRRNALHLLPRRRRSPPRCGRSTRPPTPRRMGRAGALRERWGAQYPMITKSWSERWEHIIPFLSLQPGCERPSTRPTASRPQPPDPQGDQTRGSFPDEQAATKLIYLASARPRSWQNASTGPPRSAR